MTKLRVNPAAPAQPEESRPRSSYRPWMMVLTLIMIAALLAGFWSYSEHLIGTLERQGDRISTLESRIEIYEEVLKIVTRSDPITLNSSSRFPGISVQAYLDKEKEKTALTIANAPPRDGRGLRLWVLDGEAVVSGHVLRTTGEERVWGAASVRGIRTRAGATLVLTLEPSDTSATPSEEVLAHGKIPQAR